MAKKKESELSYLQMPLPSSSRAYKQTKVSWAGLNKRQIIDTGELSMENNISTLEAPYLTPSQSRIEKHTGYTNPISMFGFDNFLLVIYHDKSSIMIDYITADDKYNGILTNNVQTVENFEALNNIDKIDNSAYYYCESEKEFYIYKNEWEIIKPATSIVKFNHYDTPTNPVDGEYIKKLLIFPDKKSMDFEITETDFVLKDITNIPDIKYATVYLSRVFAVDNDRVYASGYNDYANWNLDTIDEYNESNAWCSPAQSNTKAGGTFTGITTFQNHVVCFKRDFMHEIYNTKNPFRIQDIYAEGAIDNRTIQDVDGSLIFVSEDDVKVYTGSNPRIIGYNLNMSSYEYAVSGTDGRCYYLYCEDGKKKKYLFVYDTYVGEWSEQNIENKVLNFAHNKNGMYMLCDNGIVYKMDTDTYDHEWSLETDLITRQTSTSSSAYATVNIKHIRKIQMLADIDKDAWLKVYFLYDDEKFDKDKSHLVYSIENSVEYSKIPIRVKPRKTAHYGVKVHIEGYGFVRIYELELLLEYGGDLYV